MILVIGPNGVGKTKIAYELARRNNGEIINLDRTYLYRHFPITTGLQDTLKKKGVRRHLYEVLEPQQKSIPTNDFVEMVETTAEEILSRGRLPIAEGASTYYVPALLELNQRRQIFQQIIGLRFPKGYSVADKYMQRIEQAIAEGLIEEIENHLPQYENSFLMRECHFAVPVIRHLKGKISLSAAKSEILMRCLGYKDLQLNLFQRFKDIQWIEGTDFQETFTKAEKLAAEAMAY